MAGIKDEKCLAQPTDAASAKMKIQMQREQIAGMETKFEDSVVSAIFR